MANPLRGEAVIEVEGERMTLLLDFNTFCEIEAETGLGINQLGPALNDNPTFALLRTVFWACLQEHHPSTTEKETGRILSAIGIEETSEALTRLFIAVMPKADENPPKAPTKKKAARRG